MDEDDDGTGALEECEANERLVIEIALSMMAAKGWIEDSDTELIQDLRRLYGENEMCRQTVIFKGGLMHDLCARRPGEYLAYVWEREQEENWERYEAPRWSCPCGVTYGLLEWGKATFYTLTDDGLFGMQVTDCPSCKRSLARVRDDHATGQLGLF